jgi:hypothetical protein
VKDRASKGRESPRRGDDDDDGPIKPQGRAEGTGVAGIVVNHTGESAIAQLRYRLKDVKFSSAETTFKIGEKNFNAGSYIIKADR